MQEQLQKQLNNIFNRLQLGDSPAGGSLLVYHKQNCLVNASVGQATPNATWHSKTLALNFSTGKAILATLIHVLVSRGLLDYDLPISKYWQDFAQNGKQNITLRAVLSHQAGLFAMNTLVTNSEQLLDWQLMVDRVAAMSISIPSAFNHDGSNTSTSKPVTTYSSLVFGWVLGGLIERVTHMSLQTALETYLTKPLGIEKEVFFGVPSHLLSQVAKPLRYLNNTVISNVGGKSNLSRHKPILRQDTSSTLALYQSLPCADLWHKALAKKYPHSYSPNKLSTRFINSLYLDAKTINVKDYQAALTTSTLPAKKNQFIDFYEDKFLQAVIPAANTVATSHALATIYTMLANGGRFADIILIDKETYQTMSAIQQEGAVDTVMPASMNWRLGYHKLFSLFDGMQAGFGHMGYNGSVAWCDPTKQLVMVYLHNYDTTALTDVRQFVLTESVLSLIKLYN